MSNSGSSSLRPAWKGGRGFQPPPTVTSDREMRGRSSSMGAGSDTGSNRDSNKFSALQDDDDFISVGTKKSRNRDSTNNGEPKQNSRGEAFRSSFTGPSGNRPSKAGRSLADLAARVPEGVARSQSTGTYPTAAGGAASGRRFSDIGATRGGAGGGSGDPAQDAIEARPPRNEPSAYKQAVDAAKVIRYTREKLLALRPRPVMDAEFPPPHLKHIDAAAVLLSETPQDPVCWDTLDSDEIWATVPSRRPSMPLPKGGGPLRATEEPAPGERRRSYNAPSSGRWQRGVALPPSDESGKRKDKDANSPDDLWDDPIGGATGAAMDFSAFGGMPVGDLKGGGETGSMGSADAFDFEKMAEASRKFEEELHGSKESNDTAEDENVHIVKVDPKRPLATTGMAIRSGSGDDVNVFEDFDAPSEGEVTTEQPATSQPEAIKGGSEDPTASSRLMAMIGVKKDEGVSAMKGDSGSLGEDKNGLWNGGAPTENTPGILGLGDPAASTAIPLNPWGDPILPTQAPPTQQTVGIGMDLASRLESFAAEQKAREAAEHEQKELLRRRQEQEEVQRRAMAQQQQAQERARQQQVQQQAMQQQQPSPQAQVELVLMERITTILENSWGRSDLMSILSTLHAEDSRVIPLLSNVDLLRDLIAHNPRRVALRQDPAFGTEMAVLQMTNAQFQQHEAQVRQQQEELRRREEQLRAENLQRQRSMSNDGPPRVNPDAPWFYSDPQNNIQGPFRGDEMRQWLEAGYFKGDLPISQQAGGPFIALSVIFPEIGTAFKVQQNDRAQEEAEARARAEEERMLEERRLEERRLEELRLEEERRLQERRRAEEEFERQRHAEEQARKEQEARESSERDRQEREAAQAAATDNSNGANQPSAQLKMMLGLSSSQHNQGNEAEQPQSVADKPIEKRGSKSEGKNNSNQKRAKEPSPPPQAPPPAAKPSAPAWGGAAQNTTTSRKSMSEIQKEEARRAAALAMQQGNQPRQSSSGWANVAATATAAWAPGTVKPTSAAAVVGAGQPPAAAGGRVNAQPGARAKGAAGAAGVRKPGTQQQRGSNASTTAAEEFGASMSPALEKWCKDQMKNLNGTDDLTLVSFCMTLNDPSEIRQYLTTYLGATPQVNNFATEFINKKGGGPTPQEEWETPGSAKKGRKKKGAK